MPEETETLDYTKEAIKAHVPVKRVVDGQFYIDGIRVDRWQMTQEEVREFFTEEYEKKSQCLSYTPCPIPECRFHVDGHTKRSWGNHIRNKHMDWYRASGHRRQILKARTLDEVRAIVKAETEANDK